MSLPQNKAIAEFLESGDAPIPDNAFGPGHRCSVTLKDGLELPCVMIRRRAAMVDLAERRIKEESKGGGAFGLNKNPGREMLGHFVTTGNRVNDYEIVNVRRSPFAFPLPILKQVTGETLMSWTGFVLEMRDGALFSFGTQFRFEFFDKPDNYSFDDVVTVHNHSYLDESGALKSIHENAEAWRTRSDRTKTYRERPFFECFVD